MDNYNSLKTKITEDLARAKKHFEYSYKKVQKMSFADEWNEEQLEVLESFSSRFARFSDLIISRFLRFKAIEQDPAFRGSIIDLLNLSEKTGWLRDANSWRRIRELRNVAAHEYQAEDYKKLYQEIFHLSPHLLNFKFDK